MKIEPGLQPEQFEHNREEGAQSFWGRDRQSAFFDVRVFNPYAPCQCYKKNESEKKRCYEERIRETARSPPLLLEELDQLGISTIRETRKTIQFYPPLGEMQTELFTAK